jgi:spore coat polysaccharide biosynthesis protein SpsF
MLRAIGVIELSSCCRGGGHLYTRHLGGKSLLEWVIRRAGEAARLDGIVVAASGSGQDDDLRRRMPANVPLCREPGADALSRLSAVARRFPCEGLVCLSEANPFIDAALIDRLVSTAERPPRCDYIGYCSRRQERPTNRIGCDSFPHWCRVEALHRAQREATGEERALGTRYFVAHAERYACRMLPIPAPLDRADVRLAVEHMEDWEHVETIFEALGHDQLDWQQIATFLHHQPGLRQRMAALNRRFASV